MKGPDPPRQRLPRVSTRGNRISLRPGRAMTWRTMRSELERLSSPFSNSAQATCQADPGLGLQWNQNEADVAAPGDAADFPGQSCLHDRQRHELRRRDLVHPPGNPFGGLAGHADRSADDPLDAPVALHGRAHRPRRPAPPDDVARLRAWRHYLCGCDAGVHPSRAVMAVVRHEHPGCDWLLDVLPD